MTANTKEATSKQEPGHAPLSVEVANTASNGPPAYQSHPLGPLTASEITQSSSLIKASWPSGTEIHFKIITLLEPAKAQLMPFLVAERAGQTPLEVDMDRRSLVVYSLRGTHNVHEAVVNLTNNTIESNAKLGPFQHANSDGEEIMAVEKALLADPKVQAEIAKLKLPEGTQIVIDPWIYGSDGVKHEDDESGKLFYDDLRVMQCFLYMRDPENSSEADSCHYAFPLPVSPVIDPATLEVIRVDILPTGLDDKVEPLKPWQPRPPNEYIPEAQPSLRTDLKPLHVVQPEGVSFTVEPFSEMGRLIRWQKWDFKLGFNQREGMVLYDVHYDNKPLFYRLSLSDMAIPYSDPRHPFHRKAAFDLGDAGAGIMANNLKLGCDCLGSIYYISGVLTDGSGSPVNMPNVICVHEQDAGIGWKHTNYRTNRAVVTRQRELVLQTILTVSNYEYILSFVFNTSADLAYEARATGILSTQPVDLELSHTPHPYGTIVHPGVLAGYHQHFFSLRIDPMLSTSSMSAPILLSPSTGRPRNAIVYEECVPLPFDPSKDALANNAQNQNPHGTGYTLRTTPILQSGGYDLSPQTGRIFKILSRMSKNPVNNSPAGYKLHIPPMQPMLAHPSSFHHKRAEFADHSVYVTKYREGELYAGGKYTNQSRGGTGVRSWADRRDKLDAADALEGGDDGNPVVWVQFGLQHVPRTEDFPVMPVETTRVVLRPANFFERNPAIDVRESSRQEVNCSVGLSEQMLARNGKDVVGKVKEIGEKVLGVNLGGGSGEGDREAGSRTSGKDEQQVLGGEGGKLAPCCGGHA
ncbi:copper amine oxidase [Copromyces sp. CBS 386.78]|nr:copper amine oxidase [Copromyces sp. CBS 386.78]